MLEWLENIDTEIFLHLNSIRSGFCDTFFYLFSGKFIWIPMYAAILFTFIRSFNWKQAIACVLAVALTITLADQICATFIRPFIERPRPSASESPIVSMVKLVNGYRAGGRYGFPSCHAANTFALATLISLIIKRQACTFFMFIWAAVTCYSRVYLGAHYPGDLIAGAIAGSLIALAVYIGMKALETTFIHDAYINQDRKVRGFFRKKGYSYYPSDSIITVGLLTIIYIAILSL